MTNNEIIFETVRNTFTPAQLAELVQATYTAEQIAARRAVVTITVDEGSEDSAEVIFSAMLAADTFHTFAEWKRMGYSVKKGAKSALTCQLASRDSAVFHEVVTPSLCATSRRTPSSSAAFQPSSSAQSDAASACPNSGSVSPFGRRTITAAAAAASSSPARIRSIVFLFTRFSPLVCQNCKLI